MALDEARRPSLLAYCKLTELADDPEVEMLLPMFYDAAVGYLANAGVTQPEEGSARAAQYDLAVNYLVLDAWDHRDTAVTATVVADSLSFRQLITQLKLTDPDFGGL